MKLQSFKDTRPSSCFSSNGLFSFSQYKFVNSGPQDGKSRGCLGRSLCCLQTVDTHTHYTRMFIHILHPFMESPASLFAIYSYFLETLKASHLIASNNSHLSVVNTKAISFLE